LTGSFLVLEFLNHGAGEIVDPIVSFRMAGTGAWEYQFYEDRMLLGSVSCVLKLNATVRITAPGISWYSSFNMDNTIVPGISRKVNENTVGEEVYRIVYCQRNFYRMIRGDANILVERRDGACLFGAEGMPVTAITERIEDWPWSPPGAEPYFVTGFYGEKISREFCLAVLAFPALRFC